MKCLCGNKLEYEKSIKTFYCNACESYYDINMNKITKEDVYSKSVEYQFQNFEEYEKSQTPTVSCPYCKSTSTSKITTTEKAVNVALFGILGNKRKYQWHCNNCNSDF